MKNRWRRYAVILSLAAACLAQERGSGADAQPEFPPPPETQAGRDIKLPNGKSQRDEILKAEYTRNIKDAQELVELSEQLRDSLEKSNAHVLSLADLKKTEDIEKLARKIRTRMRRN